MTGGIENIYASVALTASIRQITKFLAEARMQQAEKFNLRAFHDFVWLLQGTLLLDQSLVVSRVCAVRATKRFHLLQQMTDVVAPSLR